MHTTTKLQYSYELFYRIVQGGHIAAMVKSFKSNFTGTEFTQSKIANQNVCSLKYNTR